MARRKPYLRERSIALRIGRTLRDAFEQPEEILSVREGLMSECPWCERSGGICAYGSTRYCRRVYRAGTLLEEYEISLAMLGDEAFGHCVQCGAPIPEAILRESPSSCLCSGCRAAVVPFECQGRRKAYGA